MPILMRPITRDSAWRAEDPLKAGRWRFELTSHQLDDADRAIAAAGR